LYPPDKILDNFLNLDQRIAVRDIAAASEPVMLEREDRGFSLPETFVSRDSVMNTRGFLDVTQSTGMLVYHKGKIIYEAYERGMSDTTTHISWSLAKSVVSALIGIAMDEGLITSEEELVTQYVPSLKGSAYDGVTIKQCLQMSSGVKFDETYGDPNSDITRFPRAWRSINRLLISL
jgi:CubicO group peptidase (beta-lactamase class C family)